MTCPQSLMQERFHVRPSSYTLSVRMLRAYLGGLKPLTECIKALVEFSYSGELTFTTTNFAKMKHAIRELKMKNIDEESLLKIEEDIEQTNEGIHITVNVACILNCSHAMPHGRRIVICALGTQLLAYGNFLNFITNIEFQ